MRNPSRSRSLRHPSRGQALVEFALAIPVFILLLVACVDLGRAVFAYNSVTNAAREGARLAIVNQDPTLIQQRALNELQMAEGASPNVSVTFRKATPNADYSTNAVCSPVQVGCVAIVRFETTYRPLTPIVSNILFSSGVTLVSQSFQTIEFICPNTSTPVATNCPKQP